MNKIENLFNYPDFLGDWFKYSQDKMLSKNGLKIKTKIDFYNNQNNFYGFLLILNTTYWVDSNINLRYKESFPLFIFDDETVIIIKGMKKWIKLIDLLSFKNDNETKQNIFDEIDYDKDYVYEITIKQFKVNKENSNKIINEFGLFNNKQFLRERVQQELKTIASSFERQQTQNISISNITPFINPHFIAGFMHNELREMIRTKIYNMIDPNFNFVTGTRSQETITIYKDKCEKMTYDDIIDINHADDFILLFDKEYRISYKSIILNKQLKFKEIKLMNGESSD